MSSKMSGGGKDKLVSFLEGTVLEQPVQNAMKMGGPQLLATIKEARKSTKYVEMIVYMLVYLTTQDGKMEAKLKDCLDKSMVGMVALKMRINPPSREMVVASMGERILGLGFDRIVRCCIWAMKNKGDEIAVAWKTYLVDCLINLADAAGKGIPSAIVDKLRDGKYELTGSVDDFFPKEQSLQMLKALAGVASALPEKEKELFVEALTPLKRDMEQYGLISKDGFCSIDLPNLSSPVGEKVIEKLGNEQKRNNNVQIGKITQALNESLSYGGSNSSIGWLGNVDKFQVKRPTQWSIY